MTYPGAMDAAGFVRMAAASEATSESCELETPSHTTSAARDPGLASAQVARASSFRVCATPRSQTAPTQAAGASSKCSRSVGALAPQWVQ